MISSCLEGGREFGIVYYNGSNFRSTGCCARVISVLKHYDDGKSDILIEGTRRFTLNTIDESGTYLKGEADFFNDCHSEESRVEARRLQLEAVELFRQFTELNNKRIDSDYISGLPAEDFSFLLSGSDLFNIEEKQENLEISSTPNRIQNLITSVRRAIRRSEANHKLLDILGDESDIRHIFN